MIYGWCQTFHQPPDWVLHGISYQNLVLLSKAAPSYKTKTDKEDTRSKGEKEWDDRFDADNPDNFKD